MPERPAADPPSRLKPALAFATLVLLVLFRSGRIALALLLVLKFGGWPGTLIAAALITWRGLDGLVRIGAFAGALLLWHAPVLLALLIAAPRAFTMLPGVVANLLARWRHPRPRWAPLPPLARLAPPRSPPDAVP